MGRRGLGKYRLKEPVGVFVSPLDEVYVADWHNHRVVVYSNRLEYIREFGHYGRRATHLTMTEKMRSAWRFLRVTGSGGSYIREHFGRLPAASWKRTFSVGMLIRGLAYWYEVHGGVRAALRELTSAERAMDKPNGVAFVDSRVIVTQKNARCVSIYEKDAPHRLIGVIDRALGGAEFGRLGNVAADESGRLFVCDEPNGVIWKVDPNMGAVESIAVGVDSGVGRCLPFSCCFVSDSLLLVCGGFRFQILDLRTNRIAYSSERLGELHGVAYDARRQRMYLADRSNGMIRVYRLGIQK
jgi:DNA-binding beta-propeller fold protein YncE